MSLKSIRHSLANLPASDEDVFYNRRQIIKGLGLLPFALSMPLMGEEKGRTALDVPFERPKVFPAKRNPKFNPKLKVTDRMVAATHNNFYEFLPGKGGPVWRYTEKFEVDPWKVEVVGECEKPQTFDLDDLFKFEHEERLYKFRCVETWAMNIPWTGFPLKKLLDKVKPTSKAKHVRFITANKPKQMPGLADDAYNWPYYESLRIDEATHDLCLLATGVYGKPLLKQHGAPF